MKYFKTKTLAALFAANVELRYAMHGASNNVYGGWGQLTEYYILRFADDMTR